MADIVFFDNYNAENLEFSNWFECEFRADGRIFKSIEQYMMYEKALTFGDDDIAGRVLDITDPADIKALGRQVKNYDNAHWNGRSQLVVYKGLLAKFSQNEALKQKLFSTGCSPSANRQIKYGASAWGRTTSAASTEHSGRARISSDTPSQKSAKTLKSSDLN